MNQKQTKPFIVALEINRIKTSAVIPRQHLPRKKQVLQKAGEVGYHKVDEREIFWFKDRGMVKLPVLRTKVSARCQHGGSGLRALRHAGHVTARVLNSVGQSQHLAAFR